MLAGSRLETSLLSEARAQLCPNVICAYGSTELGPVAYGPASAMPGIDGATGFVIPGEVIEIHGKESMPQHQLVFRADRRRCRDIQGRLVLPRRHR
jgi:acyl-coenzyme A synthetase/AMP-(fatty) acid ligase